MEISSLGVKDLPKFEKFKCDKCGCEFNCESDEYYEDLGGAENRIDSLTVTYNMMSTVIKDYLVCSCPECHKIVKKVRERENKNWYMHTSPSVTLLKNPCREALSETEAKEYTFTCQLEDIKEKSLNDILN